MAILEVSFREVDKTPDLEELIRTKAAKLEKVSRDLVSCRVSVEKPQKNQRTGNSFRVRIELGVPGEDIVVVRESSKGDMHDPVHKVLNRAFTVALRTLKEHKERVQGEVKAHAESEDMALVFRVFRKEGYGFLRTPEGREIYFHRNSVLHGDFERLTVGTGVRFTEEMGEEGPQATTVQIVDKPGVAREKVGKQGLEISQL
jgi:cold shock CspA family protein/ribosome-associated translation inhibitor RaiA